MGLRTQSNTTGIIASTITAAGPAMAPHTEIVMVVLVMVVVVVLAGVHGHVGLPGGRVDGDV